MTPEGPFLMQYRWTQFEAYFIIFKFYIINFYIVINIIN